MNRRELIVAGTAALAAGTALAHEDKKPHHHHHDHPKASPELLAVASAAQSCVAAGTRCITHCMQALGMGDKSMKACNEATHNMVAVAQAAAAVFTYQTGTADAHKSLLRALRAFAERCKAECAPHAPHHPECKACHDSCSKTLAAIKAALG